MFTLSSFTKALRRYFISGLLVWLPIWVTLLVIKFLVDILGNTMLLLPHRYQPDQLLGFHVPGIGVVITLGVILTTGLIAANFLGRRIFGFWDSIMGRIPLVRSIYNSVKEVSQTLFMPNNNSFRKVLMVEYPRKGMWSLAFQTGDGTLEAARSLDGEELVSIFIPTTPNPTSGFLMMIPKKEALEINMSVEQALKFVISLGVVQPVSKEAATKTISNRLPKKNI